MSPAGDHTQLDVCVHHKAYQTASGETHVVLRDLAFSLHGGEVCAILGPSGSGKTTLLRIMAGLDQEFDGTLSFPPDLKLAVVFQEPRLLPWRTVLQNIKLAAPQATDDEIAQIAARLGIAGHMTFYPGELSLGLARRVAMARALAVKPDLFMLDEPFVSLDKTLAVRLREELASLVEARPITTMLVTHDVEEAVRLSDRILIFSTKPARVFHEIKISRPRRAMSDAEADQLKAEIHDLFVRAAE